MYDKNNDSSKKGIIWYNGSQLFKTLTGGENVSDRGKFNFGVKDKLRFKLNMTERTLDLYKGDWKVHTVKDLPKDTKVWLIEIGSVIRTRTSTPHSCSPSRASPTSASSAPSAPSRWTWTRRTRSRPSS